jgi:predicted nuclease with TOPRIM domain
MQVELSQTKDKLKEAEITISQYKEYIDNREKDYEDLLDKYNFVLKKLSNNPEIQKQTDEMIKFYNYMTSHDRVV